MQVFRHINQKYSPSFLTIGNYDGIHLGHQAILKKLISESKSNNILSSVMTFEPHPREFFSPKLAPKRIISLREKLEYFDELKIDQVFIVNFNDEFSRKSYLDFIEILKKNIQAKKIIIGNDFRFGKQREGNIDKLIDSSVDVCVMNKIEYKGERVSSTIIRDSLAAGDLKRAAMLLGRSYSISGKVVHGDKRGREIGFPTANIHMFHNRPPLKGVFAVKLNNMYGVANLGVRPTIAGFSKLNLEVHLFNFSKNIYGKHAHVTFLKKIRDEKKFENIDALKKQIQIDIDNVKKFFKEYD
ncbi:bifunctional riboflavin kinase/FAD synthetase [Methylophilaceae bacterium]|nr:bifunctional riboflavin kinase/FAD synthetase [Methylophilaceae bacterium]